MNDPSARDNPSALFTREWRVYRKIYENDYLAHKTLIDTANSWLLKAAGARPRFIDLGCGDGLVARRFLENRSFRSYIGVDGSAQALALAQIELAPFGSRITLIEADLRNYLNTTAAGCCDVLIVSYALHHLLDSEKAAFLQDSRRAMADGGLLILIDLLRPEQESRLDYLDRLCLEADQTWTALEAEERSIATRHIREHDHPARLSDLSGWSEKSGFQLVGVNTHGHFFSALCFRASES